MLVLLLLLPALLPVPVRAYEDVETELGEQLEIREVEEAAPELPGSVGVLDNTDPEGVLLQLFTGALKTEMLRNALRSACAVLLMILGFSALKGCFQLEGSTLDPVELAGTAAIALTVSSGQSGLLELGYQTVAKLQDFANVLLPVLASAVTASGQFSAGAAKYSAAALFLNLLVNAVNGMALPLVQLYFAAAVAEAATDSGVISGAVNLLKWMVTMTLTVIMLAFTLYLSICSITSGAADAALTRSAKTLVSTALPVIGGIAADAAGAILASAGVIQKSVGVFGLLAVTALVLGPFAYVGSHYLLFKGASAIASGVAGGRLARQAGRCSEAFGMTLACLGACSLLLYFSIFSMLSSFSL